jgi:ABC-2 type transport system permease protein
MFQKILLIIRREYLTRVRKKSFIVMTILAPLLVILFYGVIFYFTLNKDIGSSLKTIFVEDQTGEYSHTLKDNDYIHFVYGKYNGDNLHAFLSDNNYYGLLRLTLNEGDQKVQVKLISKEQSGFSTTGYISSQLEEQIKSKYMNQLGINSAELDAIKKISVSVKTEKITEKGTKTGSIEASTAIGFMGAFIIYLFIFLYGVQVMRGVIEEKSNRIVEVIISTVKPFELMMGKIIGIALVGLTQFMVWILLVTVLGGGISAMLSSQMAITQHMPDNASIEQTDITGIATALMQFDYTLILTLFVFYFLGGYLFYGALFAAIGSAVDNETDTQQFMLPVTLPLVFAFVLAQSAVLSNPNSALAFWLSLFPLTSPVVMMVRLPFDVPAWEIALSMLCMVAGFLGTVWMAARIYRVGILMYGKKPTYRELSKWIFYK